MILVYYGPDDYRREQKIRGVAAEFLVRHPQGALRRFSADSAEDVELFREFSRVQSMFEPVKMALLERAGKSDDAGRGETTSNVVKILAGELRALAGRKEFTIIFSQKTKPAGPLAFLAKTTEHIRAESFENLQGAARESFIRREAKARNVSLADDALALLAEIYANDSWGLVTELDKLAGAMRPRITARDLEAMDLRTTPNFWNIMNAFRDRSPATRLAALEELFAEREPAQKIFHLVAYQWPERLDALAAYDRAVKSGKLDYEEVLADLAIG
jgi:DNA polymerase III delta subunit